MILHAFSIILKEFNSHLTQYYDAPVEQAKLGNLAEGVSGSAGNGDNLRNALIFSIVNTKEEKTLKIPISINMIQPTRKPSTAHHRCF
jgi:hypothetical protein